MTLKELQQKESALMEQLREVRRDIYIENKKLIISSLDRAIEDLTFICKTEQDYVACELETECDNCGCNINVTVTLEDVVESLQRVRQGYTDC